MAEFHRGICLRKWGDLKTQVSTSSLSPGSGDGLFFSRFDQMRYAKSENNLLDPFNERDQKSTPSPKPNIQIWLNGQYSNNLNCETPRQDINTMEDFENLKIRYFNVLTELVCKMERMNSEEKITSLDHVFYVMLHAWSISTYDNKLGYSLCNHLLSIGGLSMLIENCMEGDSNVQFSSARVLEQCLNRENTYHIAKTELETVIKLAVAYTKNNKTKCSRVGTGILEHFFKQDEKTCYDVIRLGGLDAILFECRANDLETLRNCARSLANLSLYGGAENQEAMINAKVHMWLFPLAFNDDDNVKYYACLAIAVLVANKEIEADVLKSGTLELVEPFVTSQDPSKFANSNLANVDGQHKEWLKRLVPVLSSSREEAIYLAAFHFCMEAGIKKGQGIIGIFREIGAIEPLTNVASRPLSIASKLACQTLRLIGECVPHKLSKQVPLWSIEDVQEWVKAIGFGGFEYQFSESLVDGDMLLRLNEQNLKEDIGISNGILRMRFVRELQNLKRFADYSSKDCKKIYQFLNKIGPEYVVYTYDLLNAGMGTFPLDLINEKLLITECGIQNSIHREAILNTANSIKNSFVNELEANMDKPDVFVSYRRSSGSQLASLLKVHLELRNFSVFIDVERLEAGKFDNNLLNSIKQAKHFILVLSKNALERCVDDYECKDWLHREIVAALASNCNIIPLIDNFTWPDAAKLPEDMRNICHFNAVKWIHDYQDACIDKLERFMLGELKTNQLVTFENNDVNCCAFDIDSLLKNITKKTRKDRKRILRNISKSQHDLTICQDKLEISLNDLPMSPRRSSFEDLTLSNSSFNINRKCISIDEIITSSTENVDMKKKYKTENLIQHPEVDYYKTVYGTHEDVGEQLDILSSERQSLTHESVESDTGTISQKIVTMFNRKKSVCKNFVSFVQNKVKHEV